MENKIWDLSRLLRGKSEEQILEDINNITIEIEGFRDLLNNSTKPQDVLKIIQKREELILNMWSVGQYYNLQLTVNTSDSVALGKSTKLNQLFTEISNKTMFFVLWFQKLSKSKADKLINSKELIQYKHYLEYTYDKGKYNKSEEIEQIINHISSTNNNFSSVYDIITNDYKFNWKENFLKQKEMNEAEIRKFISSSDPKKREKAYQLLFKQYKEDSVTLTEIYKNIVLSLKNEAINVRGYQSPISVVNISNDISNEVVDTMLQVIRDNSKIFTEYFKLKWNINKKKYPYSRNHLYAPFINSEEKNNDWNYQKSLDFCIETYNKFTPEFGKYVKKICDDNSVHSHPQKNKDGGAFCSSFPTQSPFILLNHNDRIDDLFTIMHEFGHGIHAMLVNKQPLLLQDYSIPIAETASIFGELLLADRLIKESSNDNEKVSLLVNQIDGFWKTIIRQSYFVMFELYAHDNIPNGITKDELDQKYYDLLKEQFGDMDIPDYFKHEWNMVPHIHHTPFYCYGYSFGNLLVLALFDYYKNNPNDFVDKYIQFLSSGSSRTVEDLLKEFGFDPTKKDFWEGGFRQITEKIKDLTTLCSKLNNQSC